MALGCGFLSHILTGSFPEPERCQGISLGRFAQADTIVPGGVQGYDRYAYVNNNPLRFTDPTGHMMQDDLVGGCGICEPSSGGGGNSDDDDDDKDLPSIIIPELPCGGMLDCGQETPYTYLASLPPFTNSDACYFLLQDRILCNSSAWPHFPSVISSTVNYCGNISGLACAATVSQDVATLTDLAGIVLIEAPAVATGCIGGGPSGCVIAEVGVIATWTVTLNNIETGASSLSLVLTVLDDFGNNGGWGENSSTALATWGAGMAPLTPSWDLAVDGYSSGYNHGFFNGVDTIWTSGLFK